MSQARLPKAALNIPGVTEQTRVEVLRGGLSNSSWRIQIGEDAFSVRQGPQMKSELVREAEVWRLAAAHGLAPELYYVDSDSGLIVSHWAPGITWSGKDLGVENLALLGSVLARLHALKYPAETLDLPERAEAYCRSLQASNLALAEQWFNEMQGLLSQLEPVTSCLCHNDLVAQNMIFGTRLVFIDWEYAMANDPYFDLAVVCAHHELGETATQVLLESYGAHSDAGVRERLVSWQQVYLRLYGLWLMATQREPAASVAMLRDRLR